MSIPVQRWRIVYGRGPGASRLTQRDELAAWESALAGTGLPLVTTGGEQARPRLVAAVPLPIGMTAQAEPIEFMLTERRTRAEVRLAIETVLPGDHALVDLHDVWLGAPSLPASIAAADYRIEVAAAGERSGAPTGASAGSSLRSSLAAAAADLLAADRLPRERAKGDRTVAYDLRPFLLRLDAVDAPGGEPDRAVLRMRLRVDPQAGAGRPEEVLAAVADAAGLPLDAVSALRVGLLGREGPASAD